MNTATESCKSTGQMCQGGATLKPSTQKNYQQLSLLSEDILASLSVTPGSEKAREMTATSGRALIESLPMSGPLGACLKMLLGTSRWASTKSFLTWSAKDTPRLRLIFQLALSGQNTGGKGYGFLPTPTVADAKGVSTKNCHRKRNNGELRHGLRYHLHREAGYPDGTHYPHPGFVEALMGYPEGWTELEASEMP